MKIRTKLGLGFGMQVTLVTVLGISVMFGMLAVQRRFSFVVELDAPLIANARHLSKLVVDMETGQRGFCITHQEDFLEPYTTGAKEFAALIEEEKKLLIEEEEKLVSDNSSQIAALERIERLVHQWKQKAAEPEIAMARKVALGMVDARQLQEVLGRGVGKAILDEMRGVMHAMEASFRMDGNVRGEALAGLVAKAMVDQEIGQRGFIITGKDEFLEPFTNGQKAFKQAVADLRKLNSSAYDVPGMKRDIDKIQKLAADWLEKAAGPEIAARRKMNQHPESLKDVAALLEAGTGKALLDEIRRKFDEFIEIERRYSAEHYGIASETTAWTRNLAASLLVLAICVGVVVAVLVNHAIAGPLVELARGAEAVGNGDFDTRIKVRSSDEIGVLARAFNAMASNLKRESAERKQAEEDRDVLLHDMKERVKELTCMYGLANSVRQRNTVEEIFLDIAALIPPGWHYPEITRGKVTFEDREYVVEPFEETQWKQSSDIIVGDRRCGSVEVYCLEECPELDEGPFVKEERQLIDGLAQALGEAVERKRGEQQIRDYAAVLESNNLALERLNEAAEAATQSKSEFLANMSHEIRTPMTAILGFSEVLMESLTDREQLDAAATIKRNGEYLIAIINNILDLSKIEAGKLEVEQIPCSPCQILSEIVSLMRVRANGKNLSLEIEYDGPIPQSIQSDPTRLRQILINLTGNAIKFTELGKVRLVTRLLDAESEEPKMQFEVVDSGIGMTEDQVDKLFRPFQQADTSTTRKFGGTGLGLAISKRLAEKLGGDIAVKSTAGEGSTFIVTVATGPPDGVKLIDKPTEVQLPTDSDKKPAASRAQLDCRVLLAEDGPDNQRLIAFLLKKAGAEVVVADNGQIAYDLALAARDEGTPFDVILMDMQMPVMDGYEATGKLREAGHTGPIIALTAHAMSTDRDKCLKVGCDDYMTKPIDQKKLISLVAEYASRQELHKASEAPVA